MNSSLSVVDDVHGEDEGPERGVGDDGVLALGQKDEEEPCQHEDDEEATQHACGSEINHIFSVNQMHKYIEFKYNRNQVM